MVMEDVNTESLAAMKCPLTQQPIKQAARANVSIIFSLNLKAPTYVKWKYKSRGENDALFLLTRFIFSQYAVF